MNTINFSLSAIHIEIPPHVIEGTGFLTNTMVIAFALAAILIIFCIFVRIFCIPKWSKDLTKITPLQTFLEWIVGSVTNNAKESMEHGHSFIGEVYAVYMPFIFLGIIIEFIGLRSPVSDLNMTLAFGIITFLLIHIYGFKIRRLKRFKHYMNPMSVLSDLIVPLSIALRLFGNAFSGYAVMHLIHAMPSFGGWIALRVALTLPTLFIFTAFHALMQSYIYMVLSISFVSEATD